MRATEKAILILGDLTLFGILYYLNEWETAQLILLSQGGIVLGLFANASAEAETKDSRRKWLLTAALVMGIGAGALALTHLHDSAPPKPSWQQVGAILLGEQRDVTAAIAAAIGLFSIFGSLILSRRGE